MSSYKDEYDVVLFALAKVDSNYASTSIAIAKEFSKTHRVFYIDNPHTYTDFLKSPFAPYIKKRLPYAFTRQKRPIKLSDNLFYISPQFAIPMNWASGKIYDKLNRINGRILSKRLNRLLEKSGCKNFIFINSFNPFFNIQFYKLKPQLSIYYSVDNINEAPFLKKHGRNMELKQIDRSDFVMVTSSHLKKTLEPYKTTYLVPNAADVSLFQKAQDSKLSIPEEVERLPKPIIGYTGNLGVRIDIELLKKIATQNPDKTVILVGPVDPDYRESFEPLKAFKNVVFTGRKLIDELPNYLKSMDCCIIPFEKTELTAAIYPLKLNEYLSAGKFVISTNFSQDVADFNKVIEVANSHDEFLTLIKRSPYPNSIAEITKRMDSAKNNNWSNRVKQIKSLIDNHWP